MEPPCRYAGSAVELVFSRMSICRPSHPWDTSNMISVVTLGSGCFMVFAFLCAAKPGARRRKCNEDMGLKVYWVPMKGKQTI